MYAQPRFQESATSVAQQRLFIEAVQHKLLGDEAAAITAFEAVLEADDQHSAAAYELSRLYATTAPDKALRYAEQAARLDPDETWFREHYADLLRAQGDFKKASAEYGALAAAHPRTASYYTSQAECLRASGDWRAAVKAYDQLEQQQGVTESVSRAKYEIYRAEGKNKLAESTLQSLIATFPKQVAYRYQLAAFYEEIGDAAAAKAVFQAILAINPDEAAANVALAADFKANGQHAAYLSAIEPLFMDETVAIDLKVRELLPYLTDLATYQKQPDVWAELRSRTAQLTEVHPTEAKAFSVYGDLLHLGGDLELAAQVYARAVSLNPSVYTVWEQYLYVLYDLERADDLYRASEQALDVFPNQAAINFLHGAALALRHDYDEALDFLENALFMAGGNAFMESEIRTAMALAYEGKGDTAAADEAMAYALRQAPQSASALHTQSRILLDRGALDEALTFAEKAHQYLPAQATITFTLGRIQLARRAYPEAVKHLAAAVTDAPTHLAGWWLMTYGDALYRNGDTAAAKAQWEAAAATGWSTPALSTRLATGRIPD